MTQVIFQFDELSPRDANGKPVLGMMLYGSATLESADDSEEHTFYVTDIELDGGFHLSPVDSQFGSLFQQIEREIYNDKTPIGRQAQAVFSDAVEAERPVRPAFSPRVYSALQAAE